MKWIIMLLYSLTIQFRMQHDILLRNPGQMSYFSVATAHQSWGETGYSITVYRNVIWHGSQSHGPYCRKCPAPSTADLAQSTGETTPTYPSWPFSLILLARCTGFWKQALHIVQPDTLLRWHRELFRFYWRRKSRHKQGKPKISPETIESIRKMAKENRLWGADRIRGELLKLDIQVC